jgi:hypothetical protein
MVLHGLAARIASRLTVTYGNVALARKLRPASCRTAAASRSSFDTLPAFAPKACRADRSQKNGVADETGLSEGGVIMQRLDWCRVRVAYGCHKRRGQHRSDLITYIPEGRARMVLCLL